MDSLLVEYDDYLVLYGGNAELPGGAEKGPERYRSVFTEQICFPVAELFF